MFAGCENTLFISQQNLKKEYLWVLDCLAGHLNTFTWALENFNTSHTKGRNKSQKDRIIQQREEFPALLQVCVNQEYTADVQTDNE